MKHMKHMKHMKRNIWNIWNIWNNEDHIETWQASEHQSILTHRMWGGKRTPKHLETQRRVQYNKKIRRVWASLGKHGQAAFDRRRQWFLWVAAEIALGIAYSKPPGCWWRSSETSPVNLRSKCGRSGPKAQNERISDELQSSSACFSPELRPSNHLSDKLADWSDCYQLLPRDFFWIGP